MLETLAVLLIIAVVAIVPGLIRGRTI